MRKATITVKAAVGILPTIRHTASKMDVQSYKVTGEFPLAPEDCERVMVLSGHDVYRSGTRYFIDTQNEQGSHASLKTRSIWVVSDCSHSLTEVMEQALCTYLHGDLTLVECGPVVAVGPEATPLWWIVNGECPGVDMTYSARVRDDLSNVRFIVEDPVPFSTIDPFYDFGPSSWSVAASIALNRDPAWQRAVLARSQLPLDLPDQHHLRGEADRLENQLVDAAGREREAFDSVPLSRSEKEVHQFVLEHPNPTVRITDGRGVPGNPLCITCVTDNDSGDHAGWRVTSTTLAEKVQQTHGSAATEESETFSL